MRTVGIKKKNMEVFYANSDQGNELYESGLRYFLSIAVGEN